MPRQSAPPNETKAQRFVRIANPRIAAAISAIEGIGKLVGSSYESTPEQHAKLFAAIDTSVKEAKAALAANKSAAKVKTGIL